MTKTEIMNRLFALPTLIAKEELLLIDHQIELLKAQNDLQLVKDGLYIGIWDDLGKKIDGKNAEIREAQLRQHTTIEQNEVTKANEIVLRQKYAVTCLQNEMKSLQTIVDLLKGAA